MTESKTEPKINVTKLSYQKRTQNMAISAVILSNFEKKNKTYSIIILPQLEKMELTEKNKLH